MLRYLRIHEEGTTNIEARGSAKRTVVAQIVALFRNKFVVPLEGELYQQDRSVTTAWTSGRCESNLETHLCRPRNEKLHGGSETEDAGEYTALFSNSSCCWR